MISISVDLLEEGMIPAKTIYTANGNVLLAKGCPLKKSYIEKLKKLNIANIFITGAIQNLDYFSPEAQTVASDFKVLLDTKHLEQQLGFTDNKYKIEQMFQSILEKPYLQEFFAKLSENTKVYEHSLRSTLAAIHLGLTKGYDYINLEYLAMCAMLHDIGKVVPSDNDHCFSGFFALRDNEDIDMLIALVALQHHERYDGNGLPLKLSKNQITEFARLIAVTDYYDDLIYAKQNTYRQAIFKILGGKGTIFDPDMVGLFEAAVCQNR